MFTYTRLMSLSATVLLLGLVACDEATAPTTTAVLTNAQADSVALVTTVDAAEVIEAGAISMSTGLALSPPVAGPTLSCEPVVTPFPPVNSDEDMVPDSVRFEYTDCTFTRGMMTHTLNGAIDIIDPTPTLTDFDIRTVFTAFTRTLTNSATDQTMSAMFDGSRQLAATVDTLGVTMTNFLTAFTYPNDATASHLKNWVAKFTADVPGSIALGEPLPARHAHRHRQFDVDASLPVLGHDDHDADAAPLQPGVHRGPAVRRRDPDPHRHQARGHGDLRGGVHRLWAVHGDSPLNASRHHAGKSGLRPGPRFSFMSRESLLAVSRNWANFRP